MREVLNFLRELSIQYPSPETKQQLINYKKSYRFSIKAAKIEANNNLIRNATNPTKCMWNIINEQRKVSSQKSETPNISPNKLNDFFINVALELQAQIGVSDVDPLSFIQGIPENTFHFQDVTYNEVRDMINNTKGERSRDCFGFTAEIIKGIKELIIIPLTKLMNQCLRENNFPSVLKNAVVVPVYKKGDAADPSNYRPISLLPILSKIFEKFLAIRIINFFQTDNQFGFRSGLNTTSAVLNLISQMQESFENGTYLSGTFCDLSKAFDCVSRELLLAKLKKYNFSDSSIAVLSSYLSHRPQVVRVGGVESSEREVLVGVPQGSILGPLLFLIYINDLPQADHTARYTLFADDTTIACTSHDYEGARTAAREAQERAELWFKSNNLFLNVAKTQNMVFSMRWLPEDYVTATAKFLGITLDSRLKWNHHTSSLVSKLSSNTFLLRRLSGSVSRSVLRQAYFALLHSHISYAILIWGHCTGAADVFRVQRRAVRVIANLSYRDNCRDVFVSLGILTVPA